MFYVVTVICDCDYVQCESKADSYFLYLCVFDCSTRKQIYLGGEVDVKERYVAPTVLVDSDPTSRVMQNEIFGPILPVLTVQSTDDAIRFINSRPKPLALYVFASNTTVASNVVSNTSSGSVGVNECVMQYVTQLPFGGVGASGFGKYRGKHTFELFSNKKAVLTRSDSSVLDLAARYPPYSKTKRFIMLNAM
jgi:aldehyde dehydrogenase (NAD+)